MLLFSCWLLARWLLTIQHHMHNMRMRHGHNWRQNAVVLRFRLVYISVASKFCYGDRKLMSGAGALRLCFLSPINLYDKQPLIFLISCNHLFFVVFFFFTFRSLTSSLLFRFDCHLLIFVYIYIYWFHAYDWYACHLLNVD